MSVTDLFITACSTLSFSLDLPMRQFCYEDINDQIFTRTELLLTEPIFMTWEVIKIF